MQLKISNRLNRFCEMFIFKIIVPIYLFLIFLIVLLFVFGSVAIRSIEYFLRPETDYYFIRIDDIIHITTIVRITTTTFVLKKKAWNESQSGITIIVFEHNFTLYNRTRSSSYWGGGVVVTVYNDGVHAEILSTLFKNEINHTVGY